MFFDKIQMNNLICLLYLPKSLDRFLSVKLIGLSNYLMGVKI